MQVLFVSQQLRGNNEVLNGGNVVSQSLYKSFCYAVGKDNVKLVSVPEEEKVYKRYIDYLFLRNMYTKKQENQITKEINELKYDLIVLDGSWFGKLLDRISEKKDVILFLHNIEIDYSKQRFKKNCLTLFKLRSVSINEKAAIAYSKYVFVLNNRDQKLLMEYYGRNADLLLPVVIDDTYSEIDEKQIGENIDENTLLFVGSYFSPNVEGIKWFIENVMPKVKKKLLIAGKNMERIKALENSSVKVLGTVDDLGKLYMQAEAVVLPIFSGGGMKVKTAEAMMYGKKIYGTKEALTGYDIKDIDTIIECNTAEQFVENINKNQEEELFYPEVRKRFLEKYQQKSRNFAVKEFLTNNFSREMEYRSVNK